MLRYNLIHPQLIEGLAAAGHGSRVLLADGNYPYATAASPDTRIVYLNLAPGVLTVADILPVLTTAVNFESAAVMKAPEGIETPAQDDYRKLLGPAMPFEKVERFEFYDLVRSPEVGLIVATGEERLYANLLLTIGLR